LVLVKRAADTDSAPTFSPGYKMAYLVRSGYRAEHTAALGACTSMTCGSTPHARDGHSSEFEWRCGTGVFTPKTAFECEINSGWIDHIDRDIELAGDLDDAERQRLCTSSNPNQTLTSEVNIATSLQ
jgi:putative redox protein